jgi:hypothetical protein
VIWCSDDVLDGELGLLLYPTPQRCRHRQGRKSIKVPTFFGPRGVSRWCNSNPNLRPLLSDCQDVTHSQPRRSHSTTAFGSGSSTPGLICLKLQAGQRGDGGWKSPLPLDQAESSRGQRTQGICFPRLTPASIAPPQTVAGAKAGAVRSAGFPGRPEATPASGLLRFGYKYQIRHLLLVVSVWRLVSLTRIEDLRTGALGAYPGKPCPR